MFGYVIPDKPNMLIKDWTAFRAVYCGLCKALGKTGAAATRFLTNYDSAFLAALIYAVTDTPFEAVPARCILSVKKKPIAKVDKILTAVADATVILGYFKLCDDVEDGEKSKAPLKAALKRRMLRAKKRLPASEASVSQNYSRLRELEKSGGASVDALADCFASMLSATVKELAGEKYGEDLATLSYNLGRWIYFADAIDDVEDDFKAGRFNPLLTDGFTTKAEFLKNEAETAAFLLKSSYNKIVGAYDALEITVAEGILSNIIYLGMQKMTEDILGGKEKCKMIRL
ncbi:MAG TPA: DUF5685 family protein [Eubacteriales bacterium]|jgi:hypothetical protein|nr:DUF5685 family protein [Clostridia bacterium]HRR89213.1 DUF5685 family protein [Eubacteriales bacterium]HRU84708.1 DUF5685 family protein [Eubacteriales bacterium]